MGLDSRKVSPRETNTTQLMIRTLSQLVPEKLPRDQLWRLMILESSANVTAKSVTAEQM